MRWVLSVVVKSGFCRECRRSERRIVGGATGMGITG